MKSQPDYDLAAMRKDDDTPRGRIGVAWRKDDGTIAIRLNPFVVIDAETILTLFPRDPNHAGA